MGDGFSFRLLPELSNFYRHPGRVWYLVAQFRGPKITFYYPHAVERPSAPH